MKILKIALTGGIACGKSQFGGFLAQLGAQVIGLDDISKQVTMPDSEGLKELVAVFGKQILNQNNSLNRQMLRMLLLESEKNKSLIENILHPKILKIMQEMQEKSAKKLTIVEVPLLFEKKLDYLFDSVIIVTCNNEEQLKRLKKRNNIDEILAKKMIFAQISQKDRLKAIAQIPHDIIKNNGDIQDLERQAKLFYNKLSQSVGV